MKNKDEKLVFYASKFNTFTRKSEWQTLRVLHLLPALQIFYDFKGFSEVGNSVDNQWCKELTIRFSFIAWEFNITFYWDYFIE